MPFAPVADFPHMAMLVEAPRVLLVRGQSPDQSLAQYVNRAKTKPVRYGTSGIGSANHLYGELLKIEAQAPEHDHVPYQGSAPAMQDLLAGNIDSLFDPVTTNVAQLKAVRCVPWRSRPRRVCRPCPTSPPSPSSAIPRSRARSGSACRRRRTCPRRSRSA